MSYRFEAHLQSHSFLVQALRKQYWLC